MPDDRDPDSSETEPGSTLEQWKSELEADHEDAIANPDPDEDHRIEGVAQVNYRVRFEYHPAQGRLVRSETEQVNELADPELLSCACGVRGMTREEARRHVEAARDGS
jgi:hypothetical protein